MADLLIKHMPPDLREQLEAEARKHRRSMTQEVLTILEKSLGAGMAGFPEPVRGKRPLTPSLVRKGIREGRA